MPRKGSEFERSVCKQLSLWWTGGKRDDVFWRTAGSGGRATNRARTKKATAGSYGDICALDPVGQPFLDVFTLELKRGYSRHSAADLLDRKEKGGLQEYEQWILQAEESQRQAGSVSWLIITRRDKRQALVFYPKRLDLEMPSQDLFPRLDVYFRLKGDARAIQGVLLEDFLFAVTPDWVRKVSRSL